MCVFTGLYDIVICREIGRTFLRFGAKNENLIQMMLSQIQINGIHLLYVGIQNVSRIQN